VMAGGQLTWTGGNIYGNLSANGGSINVPVSSWLGNGGELINTGNLTWTPNSGPRTGGGTVISNAPSGVISVALNGNNIESYAYGGTTAFYNAGTINVAGAGQSGVITDPFFNTGTLNINNGTLSFADGGTNSSTINVTGGADLDFSGGTFTSTAGSLITGAGNLSASGFGGTYNFAGPLNLSGSWTFGSYATVNLMGSTTVSGNTLNLTGNGNINFNGTGKGGTWQPGTVNLSGGTLGGSTPVMAGGQLTWTGGNIYGNLSANGGSINVPVSSWLGNGGELINTGNLTWTPNSGPRTGGGTVISNAPSGVISVALNGNNIESYAYGGATAFYNAGTINVAGAGQSGVITDPFYNTGTLNISSGTLSLTDGGTENGPFTVASLATLNLGGGTFIFNSGATISGAGSFASGATANLGSDLQLLGAGTFTVSGGNLTVGGSLGLGGDWTFSGGTATLTGSTTVSGNNLFVTGNGTVNFNGTGKGGTWQPGAVNLSNGTLGGSTPVMAGGQLTWTGGNIYGNLSANGGSINVPVSSWLGNGGELINTGNLTWTPNSGPRTGGGTVISNAPSGVISVALNGNNIESYAYGGTTAFYNAGTINVAGAGQSGVITDPFFNTGTLNINNGTLSFADGGTNSSTINVTGGADLDFSGGTFTSTAGSLITGAGNLSASGFGGTYNFAGPLNLSGSWTFGSYATVNLMGSTTVSGNTLNLTGNGNINFNGTGKGGTWQPGTVNLSGGTLGGSTPVMAGGQLTWTGGNIYGNLSANGGSINVPVSSWLGNGGELINTGNLTWTPNSGPRTGGGTVISNAPSGVISVALNGNNIESYAYGGATAFYNAGTINVAGAGQSGVITDPFYNTGTLNISSGTLGLNDGVSLTNGTFNFGISNKTSFGSVAIAGPVGLTGALGVTFNGYTPLVGDSFGLISYGSEAGTFTSFNLPATVGWQPSYGSTMFALTINNFVAAPTNVVLQVAKPSFSAKGFNLLVSGPVGSNYVVQVTTNLFPPNWQPLTNFISTIVSSSVTDTNATKSQAARFYRAYTH